LNKYHQLVLDEETKNTALPVKRLKERVLGVNEYNFLTVAHQLIATYLERGNIGTYDKTKSIVNKLSKFNQSTNLSFADVSVKYLEKYRSYCLNTLGNSINTIARDFSFFRTVFNYAIRQDLITENENPFHKIKITTTKTSREYLSMEEINLIENYYSGNERLNLFRDIILLQTHCKQLKRQPISGCIILDNL
jgi:site-specific recombinase XerD